MASRPPCAERTNELRQRVPPAELSLRGPPAASARIGQQACKYSRRRAAKIFRYLCGIGGGGRRMPAFLQPTTTTTTRTDSTVCPRNAATARNRSSPLGLRSTTLLCHHTYAQTTPVPLSVWNPREPHPKYTSSSVSPCPPQANQVLGF